MSRKLESNNVETRSEPWLRWGVCLSSVWWWGSDDVQVCLIKDQVKSGEIRCGRVLTGLANRRIRDITSPGRPGGWCRTGTLGKPLGRIWGSGDHGGTGDSGGQGGYGDSGGHGGSGASGGHGGYGDSGGHGGSGASGGHGGIIFWKGLDRGAIVALTKVPCMATMATRTTGLPGRPIIGLANIKHFYDYWYRPFSKQICR